MTQEKEPRQPSLFRRLDQFCQKHQFHPRMVKTVALISCAIVIFCVTLGVVSVTTVKSETVQFGLKDIGELATQAGFYTNVQTIKGSRQLFNIDIPFTENKYIFSYDGVIKAGLDFGDVDIDVNKEAHIVTIKMPSIKILSNDIDHDSLQVYNEVKNIFNPLKLSDVNLSLIEMEKQAEETAIANGLFENAQANAEVLIRGFLSAAFDPGVYSLEFEWLQ